MTASIVACGQSAQHWGEQKFDLSIGVNDAFKFGYPLDQLVIVNFPRKFTPDRMKHILNTKSRVFTHTSAWKGLIPSSSVIKLTPFHSKVRDGLIYCSKTSPMCAISLAYKQGATDIVLFGVDFENHQAYRKGTKSGDFEIRTYLKFFDEIKKNGRKVWLGAKGSVFEDHLPMYDPYFQPANFSKDFTWTSQ